MHRVHHVSDGFTSDFSDTWGLSIDLSIGNHLIEIELVPRTIGQAVCSARTQLRSDADRARELSPALEIKAAGRHLSLRVLKRRNTKWMYPSHIALNAAGGRGVDEYAAKHEVSPDGPDLVTCEEAHGNEAQLNIACRSKRTWDRPGPPTSEAATKYAKDHYKIFDKQRRAALKSRADEELKQLKAAAKALPDHKPAKKHTKRSKPID